MHSEPIEQEVVSLREQLQACESRTRLALRTLALLRQRLSTMQVRIDDAAIIFAHVNNVEALLNGEVITC